MRILLLLVLSLPAYAFATVWHFQNAVLSAPGGSVTGFFNSDGGVIRDWDITVTPIIAAAEGNISVSFRMAPDYCPLWVGCYPAGQEAAVITPTGASFWFAASPSSTWILDLNLDQGVIGPGSTFVFDHFQRRYSVEGALVTPEPALLLWLFPAILLILRIRGT